MTHRDLYPFCAELRLPDGTIANHQDCDVDCAIRDDGWGGLYLSVERIYINGRRIPMLEPYSPSLWGLIAEQIRQQAEADPDLLEAAAKRDGLSKDQNGEWRLPSNYYDAA